MFDPPVLSKSIWTVCHWYKLNNHWGGPISHHHSSLNPSCKGSFFLSYPAGCFCLVQLIDYPTVVELLCPNCPQLCWPLGQLGGHECKGLVGLGHQFTLIEVSKLVCLGCQIFIYEYLPLLHL